MPSGELLTTDASGQLLLVNVGWLGRCTFEDYDFTTKRSLTKAQLKEIASLGWLHEGRPLVLIGQTGVGKTFLGQATGLHACAHRKSALFLSVTHWMEQQAFTRATGTYLKFREKMIRPDLRVLPANVRILTEGHGIQCHLRTEFDLYFHADIMSARKNTP